MLFVSHNMGAVSRLCTRGILLDAGRIVERGAIQDVLQAYLSRSRSTPGNLQRSFDGPLKSLTISDVIINGQTSVDPLAITSSDVLTIEMIGTATAPVPDFRFAFALFQKGLRIMTLHDGPRRLPEGSFRVRATIPPRTLRPGHFSVAAGGKRVAGNEWLWGSDLALMEIIPSWEESYDPDNIGVINAIGHVVRL